MTTTGTTRAQRAFHIAGPRAVRHALDRLSRPSTRPKSTAARLRQQGVTATPEQATADNPHVPEAVLPQVIRSEPTPGTESAGS